MNYKWAYTIGVDEKGNEYFTHYACRRKSYNQNDIRFKYCAACHKFPADEAYKEELAKQIKIAEARSIQKGFL